MSRFSPEVQTWQTLPQRQDLFIEAGNTSVTVETICEKVGIAPRTFHRHFPAKEDVLGPLLQRSLAIIVEALKSAPTDEPVVDALVGVYLAELSMNREPIIDFAVMALIVRYPPYRVRWQQWNDELVPPIAYYLSTRVELSDDSFLRFLPAQLVVHTAQQALIRWVEDGTQSISELRSLFERGFAALFAGIPSLNDGSPPIR